MLQAMRDKSSGVVTWIIVVGISVVFALWGIGYYLNGHGFLAKVAAKVNGVKITNVQLRQSYQNARLRVPDTVDFTDADAKALLKHTLQNLINQQVLYQGSKNAGFGINTQDMDQLIYQMPAFMVNGKFSMARYQSILQRMGVSTSMLRQELAQNLLIKQVQAGVMLSEFVLPAQLKKLYGLMMQKRSFDYVIVPNSKFMSQVKISSNDIVHYYKAHKKDFYTHDKVKLAYLLLSVNDIAKTLHFDESDLRNYYEQNKSSFVKTLKKGAPVQLTFDQAKVMVKKQLTQDTAQKLYAQKGDKLSNLTFENPESLDFAAKQLKMHVHTTGFITKAGDKSGIGANKQVLKAAFSDLVLKQKNNSDVINLSDSQAIVVRVQKFIAAKPKALAQVKAQIKKILTEQEANAKAKVLADGILAKLNKKGKLANLASLHKLDYHKVNATTRQNKAINFVLLNAVFSNMIPAAGKTINGVVELPDLGLAVYSISKVVIPPVDLHQKTVQRNTQFIKALYAANSYNEYAKALKKTSTIKINKKVLDEQVY